MYSRPSPSYRTTTDSYRSSYYSDTTTLNGVADFEAITWRQKPIAGPEFYDRSHLSRRVALLGVLISIFFSIACIVAGVKIFLAKNAISAGVVVVSLRHGWQRELVSLAFSLLVTACTEATGYVHAIALRAALSSQRRLRFNTNLRLFSAARGLFGPNGTLSNIVMAILLIVSYSSSILVTLSVNLGGVVSSNGGAAVNTGTGTSASNVAICISDVPLIVLGVSLVLQALIALVGMAATDILTWSSSPFDITAALVHHAQIVPVPGRSMRGVREHKLDGPCTPLHKQPSAWMAYPALRRVVCVLWLLVLLSIGWGLLIAHLSAGSMRTALTSASWSFLPQTQSFVTAYDIPLPGGVAWFHWVTYYLNMAAIQGPLTLGLHCSELVANVHRDERLWRCATGNKGAKVSRHPLVAVFGSPLNVGLLVAKPVLHWMLGLAISLAGSAEGGFLTAIAVSMFPMQIMNLSAMVAVFSLIFTVVALYSPRGPQPAAYGHVQTLANLIDEWSPVMWWGDKPRGLYRHAGTSDIRLPPVEMNALYA